MPSFQSLALLHPLFCRHAQSVLTAAPLLTS
nr:MAG TPA: hypothetical protein [Bacteriophage sp.]